METLKRSQHLSDEILATIVLGIDDSAERERHLEVCTECLHRASLLNPSDTFVELLASAKTRLDRPAATAPTKTIALDNTPGFDGTLAYPSLAVATADAAEVPVELAQHAKYRPIRKLGSGGMGSVWLAEHKVMHRLVAVKAIRPEFLSNTTAKDRFLREIRATAQLQHPNIVASFDAEESDGVCLLAMEYVPGEVLTTILDRGAMPIDAACRAVRDAALGLHHAHEASLVHRDVKPSNLIRTTDGMVKVLDFGLVVASDAAESGLTGVNVVMGTPDYIAPEQAENAKLADARSDIYSLGCTLYHLLSGQVPFPRESTLKKLDAHRSTEPKPIRGLPQSLVPILNRMMAKDPAQRFPTALAAAQALEPFCTGSIPASAVSKSRWPWRTQVLTGLAFAFMAFLAAAAVQYRIKTDTGELVIETVDDDVEVVIKQSGKLVTVYDPKSKQKLILSSGLYELELNGKASGLKLDIDKATLKRGDVVIAKITREPAALSKPLTPIEPFRTLRTKSKHPDAYTKLSPDGRLLAMPVDNSTGSGVATYRMIDLLSGGTIGEVGRDELHITDSAFSTDGSLLYYLHTSPHENGYSVSEYDIKNRKLRSVNNTEPITRWPCHPSVSPDGRLLAFTLADPGDNCREIRIIEIASGKTLKSIRTPFKDGITAMKGVYSPDGQSFLESRMNRKAVNEPYHQSIITLHDLKTPANVKTWTLEHWAYDPFFVDGTPQIGASRSDGERVWFELWNIQTKESVRVIPAPAKSITLGIAKQGNRVAYADPDGKLSVVDVASGQVIWTGGPVPRIEQLRLNNDATTLVAIDRNEYRIYRVDTEAAAKPPALVGATAVAEALKPTSVIRFDLGDRFGTADVSPNGRLVAASRMGAEITRVYDSATGKLIREVPKAFIAKFTPDSKHIITGDWTRVRVVDIESGKVLQQFGEGHQLYNIFVAATGHTILTISPNRMQAWDWSTGKKLSDLPSFRDGDRHLLSHDGHYLLRQVQGKPPLEVYDTRTGNVDEALAPLRNIVEGIAHVTADGKTLICGTESENVCYDLATGKLISRFTNRQPLIRDGTLRDANHVMISMTSDRYLIGLYDLTTGAKVLNLASPVSVEGRHTCKLAQCGTKVVLTINNEIYLWDLTLAKRNTLPGKE
jgi:serine/threonine protein kinase